MLIRLNPERSFFWEVKKVAVIGPATLSIPMGTLLERSKIRIGHRIPPNILILSPDDAGTSVSEHEWNNNEASAFRASAFYNNISSGGRITTTHEYGHLSDADIFFIYAPVPKKVDSYEPDYGPLLEILTNLAVALQRKPAGKVPLLLFQSVLAPSTMTTLIKDLFADYDLQEGHDLLLGYSPHGFIQDLQQKQCFFSDKIVAGLHPETPGMIRLIYQHIIKQEKIYLTNSTTAEIVPLLENACRKVRRAFSLEIARYCDEHDIDFYLLKDRVNKQLAQSDGPANIAGQELLSPILEVGPAHMVDNDLLLWWRKIDTGADIAYSLMLQSRLIRGQIATQIIELAERHFGDISGQHIAILGCNGHSHAHDTENSAVMALTLKLLEKNCRISLFDPHDTKISPARLLQHEMVEYIFSNAEEAVKKAEYIILGPMCKPSSDVRNLLLQATHLKGIVDACNLFQASDIEARAYRYVGIGKGRQFPDQEFVQFVYKSFIKMETGLANEIQELISFLNDQYIADDFNQIHFEEIRRLAASYHPLCFISSAGPIEEIPEYKGFCSRLAICAQEQRNLTYKEK